MATTISNDVTRIFSKYEAASTQTLTAADSGKVFKLSGGAATITLPAPKEGLQLKFVVSAATTGAIVIETPTDHRDKLEGSLIVAGVVADVDAADKITVASGANIGDFVEIESDGTNYFAFGNALAAGKLAAAEI